MTDIDIKKMSIDELYKRAQTIDKNISIESSKGSGTNYGSIQQLRWMKNVIIDELKERNYTSNVGNALKGNLTNDPLAQQEDAKPKK